MAEQQQRPFNVALTARNVRFIPDEREGIRDNRVLSRAILARRVIKVTFLEWNSVRNPPGYLNLALVERILVRG